MCNLDAARAISAYRTAGRRHAEAVGQELALEHDKPAAKHRAIVALMEQPNPTSTTGKHHSYSSAELVVELDASYAAHLAALRAATVARYAAQTEARAAELTAMLELTHAASEPLEMLP